MIETGIMIAQAMARAKLSLRIQWRPRNGMRLVDASRLARNALGVVMEYMYAHRETTQNRTVECGGGATSLRFEHELTQKQIAAHVGISQMHVSRLISDALEQLKDTMS